MKKKEKHGDRYRNIKINHIRDARNARHIDTRYDKACADEIATVRDERRQPDILG